MKRHFRSSGICIRKYRKQEIKSDWGKPAQSQEMQRQTLKYDLELQERLMYWLFGFILSKMVFASARQSTLPCFGPFASLL